VAQTAGTRPMPFGIELVGELLAYVGAAVALGGAGIVAATSADSEASTEAILAISAVVLVAVGWFAGDPEEPRRRRVRAVFWFVSVQAVTQLLTVVLATDAGNDVKTTFIVIGLVSTAYAAVLWFLFRSSLQEIALYAGLIGTLTAIVFPSLDSALFGPPDLSVVAVTWWALGIAWMVLAWRGVVGPPRTGLVLGALTVVIAPLFLSVGSGTTGAVAVAIVGVIVLGAGEVLEDRAVVGIGVVALLFGSALATTLVTGPETSKAVAALVIGLVALGAATAIFLRGGGAPPSVEPVVAPPAVAPPEPPIVAPPEAPPPEAP
jgi:hypothetical protein